MMPSLPGGSRWRRHISIVLLEIIEVHQVVARAIDEEAEELFEDGCDRQPLPALSHRSEESIEVMCEIDPSQIPDEENSDRHDP